MGRVVKAKKIPKKEQADQTMRLLARLCFFYPQYSFSQARRLPARRVRLLLEEAHRIEAERMAQLVQIAAAPHTKKGAGVKSLFQHYERIMNG